MPDNNPPVAFYFRLAFLDTGEPVENSFQEVSGLTIERESEDVVEGGENGFVHRLPAPPKYSNLVLKRGIAAHNSPLVKWCQDVFDNGFAKPIEPREMLVSLMNEQNTPHMKWLFKDAYPVKWSIDSFNSTNNEVAILAIEFKYNFFKRLI